MSHPLSDRIKSLPVSQTLALAAKDKDLNQHGKDNNILSMRDTDLNPHDLLK